MIVVTVSLVSAITKKTSTLATMVIANDGTGSRTAGNYECLQLRAPAFNIEKPVKRARVNGHRRLALSVWSLVAKALQGLGHGISTQAEFDVSAPKCTCPAASSYAHSGCEVHL